MTPRSVAIPKNWKTFDVPSFFSAFGYPVLGVALFTTMVLLGVFVSELTFHWWYAPLAVGVIASTRSAAGTMLTVTLPTLA